MSFTEIVAEAGDARSPLLRPTRASLDAFAVLHVLDDGQASRRLRALLLGHGPAPAFEGVAREHAALRPQDEVEVAFATPRLTALHLAAPMHAGGHGAGLLGLPASLREAGLDGFLDPILLRAGRARLRIVVPRHVEPADAMRAMSDAPAALGLADLRVLRVGPANPADHLDVVRRMLPPEQEDLLRLAASMGYYATPKQATLEDIAREVGLSISPIHKRLKAAEETLVAAHVDPATRASAPRRRARGESVTLDASQPWEVTLRLRAPEWGPAAFARAAGAPILFTPTSEDAQAGAVRALLVAFAPEDVQAKLFSALESRPEIAHAQMVGRDRAALAARFEARGRAGFGLAWWNEAWGGDVALRHALFEGDDCLVRVLVTRPLTQERFQRKLEDAARAARWTDLVIAHARPLGQIAPPAEAHEPLTSRQLEVLRVAHALGYYQTPRGCTLEGVAKTLGVSANAIHKNLVLAESKIIASYLTSSF